MYNKRWSSRWSLKFRLRKTDEARDSLLDEIKNNDLMGEKYKKHVRI